MESCLASGKCLAEWVYYHQGCSLGSLVSDTEAGVPGMGAMWEEAL